MGTKTLELHIIQARTETSCFVLSSYGTKQERKKSAALAKHSETTAEQEPNILKQDRSTLNHSETRAKRIES